MKSREELDEIYRRRMRRQRWAKLFKTFKEIDPMPWGQAFVLGLMFASIVVMAVL